MIISAIRQFALTWVLLVPRTPRELDYLPIHVQSDQCGVARDQRLKASTKKCDMPSLHARRKHAAQSDGQIDSPNGKEHPQSKSKSRFRLDGDLQITFVIVGLFVLAGLGLGSLFLHHHHRKVILHTIRDPWGHGRAAIRHLVRRRHPEGFHHHFFSGAPRFVSVLMPSVVNPPGRSARLKAIHDTWGPYGRAIYVVHDNAESVSYTHLTLPTICSV